MLALLGEPHLGQSDQREVTGPPISFEVQNLIP